MLVVDVQSSVKAKIEKTRKVKLTLDTKMSHAKTLFDPEKYCRGHNTELSIAAVD